MPAEKKAEDEKEEAGLLPEELLDKCKNCFNNMHCKYYKKKKA
jgi:hypothetical protein